VVGGVISHQSFFQRQDQVHAEGVAFGAETAKDARAEAEARRQPQQQQPARTEEAGPGGSFWAKLVLGMLVVMVAVFALCVWKKPVALTVASHAWERTIEIEQRKEVRDSAWCDQMPPGASDVSRSKEVRSHKQVKDGETCSKRRKDKGDGTFTETKECQPKYRDEPVYDDKCSYTVDRWEKHRTASSSGRNTSPAPFWPEVRLGRACNSLGCEREGAHRETYSLQLAGSDGKSYSCSMSASRWNLVADGVKKPIKIAVLTGIADCDALSPAGPP
jgi:hypothetical protein